MTNIFQMLIAVFLLLVGQAARAQISLNNLFLTSSGNVGIGTATPQSTLAVNGTVTTQRVVVSPSGWSDFVFDKGYPLLSLPELRRYIAENKHLPDVITAEEVKKSGVELGDNQSVLLRKIEELTLYAIEEHEKNEQLEARLDRQEREIGELKRKIESSINHIIP